MPIKNKALHLKYNRTYNFKHKDAIRSKRLQKLCGITLEDYNQAFVNQKGLCLGCYRHQTALKTKLVVDHCHKTSKFRGLLCGSCNRSLGLVFDNVETLRRLANYLERFINA